VRQTLKDNEQQEWVELWKTVVWFLFATIFIFAGCMHLLRGPQLLELMPAYLPFPLALIYISGMFEIIGGAGLLCPLLRKSAGIGLALLLIAVFPVNIQMALHPELVARWDVPELVLWLRLPLQVVLIGLVLWASDVWELPMIFKVKSRKNFIKIFTDLPSKAL
jgi:uncharacterized membrane protein